MVKVWIHDGQLYQVPHEIRETQVKEYIKSWRETLYPIAKKENQDHYIYSSTVYNDQDRITEVNIYMKPCSDDVFHTIIAANDKALASEGLYSIYGAFHKGTSY